MTSQTGSHSQQFKGGSAATIKTKKKVSQLTPLLKEPENFK